MTQVRIVPGPAGSALQQAASVVFDAALRVRATAAFVRGLAVVVALVIALAAPAWATTCTLSQTGVTMGTTNPQTFGSNPTNGSTVICGELSASTLSGTTCKDSNALSLTSQLTNITGGSSTAFGNLWDYTVSGSPTGAGGYTMTGGGGVYGAWNITTVLSAHYCGQNGNTACTIGAVGNGDFQACFSYPTNTLTLSNGSNTTDYTNSSSILYIHAFATSTTSSTCTTAASLTPVVLYGDYSCTAAAPANPPKGVNAFPVLNFFDWHKPELKRIRTTYDYYDPYHEFAHLYGWSYQEVWI